MSHLIKIYTVCKFSYILDSQRVFSSLMNGRVLKMAELLPLEVNIKAVKFECVLFAILHVTCRHTWQAVQERGHKMFCQDSEIKKSILSHS